MAVDFVDPTAAEPNVTGLTHYTQQGGRRGKDKTVWNRDMRRSVEERRMGAGYTG